MNTESRSGYLDFLRSIEPLGFDPELVDEYLECFHSDSAKSQVVDELEHLYEEVPNPSERLELVHVIGHPGVSFDSDEEDCLASEDEDPFL